MSIPITKKTSVLRGGSLPDVIAASSLFNLDRLSLQVSVAVELKSAKLFREINPIPPPQTCDDPSSYKASPALAADAFRRITTSSQVGLALRVISQLPHPDELAICLAGALPEVRDNWRAFSPTDLPPGTEHYSGR